MEKQRKELQKALQEVERTQRENEERIEERRSKRKDRSNQSLEREKEKKKRNLEGGEGKRAPPPPQGEKEKPIVRTEPIKGSRSGQLVKTGHGPAGRSEPPVAPKKKVFGVRRQIEQEREQRARLWEERKGGRLESQTKKGGKEE